MHFTSLTDRTDTEYLAIIDMAMRLKRDKRRDDSARGRVLGLLFFNPSLRTKVSFETLRRIWVRCPASFRLDRGAGRSKPKWVP